MSDVTKSILAATGVIVAVAAVYGGAKIRDRVDGVAVRNVRSEQTLVASRDNAEVPEADYFYALARLVKREYVEPVTDDQKLASGAVRGMIASLGDPKSLFMEPQEFKTYLGERGGRFEGIGARLELIEPSASGESLQAVLQPSEDDNDAALSTPHIPRLTVTALTPGGPAERAGVRVGDAVYSVDGHWVVSGELREKFRKAEKQFVQKKIDAAQLNVVRKEIHAVAERALLPLRAVERLSEGTSGVVTVEWDRGATRRVTKIEKAESHLPEFSVSPERGPDKAGVKVVLPFVAGSADNLRQAIKGKTAVTIDLRDNVLGDEGEMRKCLAVLAPAGEYGRFVSVHSPRGIPLSISSGNANAPAINLLVDRSTRGAAEIFALALSSHHRAKLTGAETGGDPTIEQTVELPDGSGYTLRTGAYRPFAGQSNEQSALKKPSASSAQTSGSNRGDK